MLFTRRVGGRELRRVVQSGVDLTVGGVDRVGAPRRRVGMRLTDQAGEWSKKTQSKLDQ